jgi:hypothetical protein
MPESQQSSSNIGASAVWILLAAAGTYFVVHTAPLEGNRPPTTEVVVRQQANQQDIESRLWRDPFAVVAERLAKSTDLKRENCGKKSEIWVHCVSPLKPAKKPPKWLKPPNERPKPPIVMVASVSGAPYSEDHEYRRRQRYAIVAGLARQGFVPRDAEHLGFFWPRALGKPPDWRPEAVPPERKPSRVSSEQMPEVVPFEWFDTKDKKTSALLLWFDEDVLSGSRSAPLKGFDEFLCRTLRKGIREPLPWGKAVVLGPELSTTLKAMVGELVGTRRTDGCPEGRPAEFYVFSATAADTELIPGLEGQDCPDTRDRLSWYFAEHGVWMYRLTATDAALACSMRDELELRKPHRLSDLKQYLPPALLSFVEGIVPKGVEEALGFISDSEQNHYVLISEWDTFYGQSLPTVMKNCLGPPKETGTCNKLEDKVFHRYSYLQGLDGQLPNVEDRGSGNASKGSDKNLDASDNQDKGSKDRTKTWPNGKPNDRAEGQGQYDYLRRMGEEIARFDARLRSGVDENPENRNRNGIFAVGVLGSDRYDKLLILQALRPLLPNVRFFMTDLDALVLHPTVLPQTRNLLIASSFALQLGEELQGEIPPFRSSYQTAAFFATQVAIKGPVEGCFGQVKGGADAVHRQICIGKEPPPLLFEVGLSTLFQIPSTKSGDEPKCVESQCGPLGLGNIHPRASDMFPQAGRGAPLAAAMVIIAVGFGMTLSCGFLRRKIWLALDGRLVRQDGGRALFVLGGHVILGLALLVVALAVAIFYWWPLLAGLLTDAGQPMLWLEGISIWPTIVLRTAILVICLLLIFHGHRWLDKDFHDLGKEMRMQPAWDQVTAAEEGIANKNRPWIAFVSYFDYRMSGDDRSPYQDKDKSPSPYLLRFWGQYIYQAQSKARIIRVVVYVAAFFVLWGILELVFGNPPIPTRGMWALGLYTPVTWMLNVATLFLTLFVADATYLCWRVVEALRQETDEPDTRKKTAPRSAGAGTMPPAAPATSNPGSADAAPDDNAVASNALPAEKQSIWPDTTLTKFDLRVGLPAADLEHWIDLVFISKRTKTITTLIYLPFIVVALVIVSRSRLFANYAPSVPEMLIMALALLIVVASAIALRQAAEASRARAHRRLNDQIMVARQSEVGERRASQLELLSRRVDELHEGALTPFSQQPLLRAMLLPLGSFGGTALLEYLLLPGLS